MTRRLNGPREDGVPETRTAGATDSVGEGSIGVSREEWTKSRNEIQWKSHSRKDSRDILDLQR